MVNNNKCNNPFNWSSLFTIFFRRPKRQKCTGEAKKGIVFLSKLMLLFEFCHLCLFPNPKVAVTQTGTMLSIVTECSKCGETYTWKSQPDLMGRFPAGNLLLSFAVLCAGASIRKVLLVFRHVGVLSYHLLWHSGKNIKANYWNSWETKRWYWLEMDVTIVWATQPNTSLTQCSVAL